MKRAFDPLRLDVEAACRAGATLEGEWPLADLARLMASSHPESPPAPGAAAAWSVRAERRADAAGSAQCWLHLRASASLALVCQRCLGPVEAELEAERSFLFVHGEEQAEALDAEIEDDVLALTRSLDLRELVEDELLLALPLVPRHDRCPQPLVPPPDPEGFEEERPNPFAALRGLRRRAPE